MARIASISRLAGPTGLLLTALLWGASAPRALAQEKAAPTKPSATADDGPKRLEQSAALKTEAEKQRNKLDEPAAAEPVRSGLVRAPEGRPPAPPGERWALLIGIDKYEHMPRLHFCGRDADRLARSLVEHGGYERQRVRVLSDEVQGSPNPSFGNIVLALDTFLKQAKPEDTVLLAFSGHGDVDAKGRSFLMPIDGNPGNPVLLERTGIPLELVHEFLDRCPARQKVVIVDACHSGGKAGDARATGFDPAKAPPPGRGIVELFSCDAQQVSWEDEELKQGVFTYYLADALSGAADVRGNGNRDGFVTADEVYAFTCDEVTNHVRAKFHREQSPVQHVSEAGRIVLAQRDSNMPRSSAEEPREISQALTLLQKDGLVSPELVASSEQWLGIDSTFGPARSMRLLLGLLGQRVIYERQFWGLAGHRASQLRSHVSAARSAAGRKMYLLSMGIDSYAAGPRQWFAASDARLLVDILGRSCASATLLVNEQVTENNVAKSIRETVAKSRGRDVILIAFAGFGSHIRQEGKITRTDCGWLLHGCQLRPSNAEEDRLPHRGGLIISAVRDPKDEVLSIAELDDLLGKCDAHVIVLSDACYVYPGVWGEFVDFSLLDSSKAGRALADAGRLADRRPPTRDRTRIFIGSKGMVFESEKIGSGALWSLFAQGLAGSADLVTPRLGRDTARERAGVIVSLPDGFVTLGELVGFVNRHRGELVAGWNEEVSVWGQIAGDDPVLVRHSLPID
jgi:uncharacterized caspase-like protein